MSRLRIAKFIFLSISFFAIFAEVLAIGITPAIYSGIYHVHKGEKLSLYSFKVLNMIDNNGDGVAGVVSSMAYDHWTLRYISFRQHFQVEGESMPQQTGYGETLYLDATKLHVGGVYTFVWSGVCDEPTGGPIGSRTCIHTSVQSITVIPYVIPIAICEAVNGSYGSVNIHWTRPVPLYCPIDHYAIFRAFGDSIQIGNLAQATLVTGSLDSSSFSVTIENAPRGAKPYYAVVAFDEAGEAIGISQNLQPDYPRSGFGLTSPRDGERLISTTPTFTWAGGIAPYTLWISSDPNFAAREEYSLIPSQSFIMPAALNDHNRWYWKVFDSRGIAGDESGWSFRTNITPLPPADVEAIHPIAGSLVETQIPALAWSGVGTAGDSITYHLVIADDPAFAHIVTDVNTDAAFFNLVSRLPDDHLYYWKVRATGEGGAAGWSAVESFDVHAQDPPSPVQLIYPGWSQQMSGGPELPQETDLHPTFRWTHAEDPDPGQVVTYTLWYSTDPFFATKVQASAIADTTYTPSQPLAEDQTYYWKVFAIDNAGKMTSSAGLPYAFVTNSLNRQPSEPVLVSPIRGRIISDSNIEFGWSDVDDDLYDLKLFDVIFSTRSDFRDTVSTARGVYGTNCSLPTLATGKYYWRVAVRCTTIWGLDGGTNESAVDSFEVSSSFIREVTNPAADDIWDVASVQTIRWSVYAVDSIAVEYSTDAGSTWSVVEDSLPAAIGWLNWTVPNTPSSNCLIRVRDIKNPLSYACSVGNFCINLGIPMLTGIVPRTQVRSSTASVRVTGYKLPAGALAIKLVNQGSTEIVARNIVSLSPTMVQCTFDLPAITGIYHLIASTAAGNDTLPSCFTVQRPVVSDSGWTVRELLATGSGLGRLAVADLDGDRLNEIYCIEESGIVLQIVRADTGWVRSDIASGMSSRNLTIGDVDNDGRPEIYSTDNSCYNIRRLCCDNGWHVADLGPAVGYVLCMTVADGNYDGKFEIYTGAGDWKIRQWSWNGSALEGIQVGSVYWAVYDVAVGDGNNDYEVEIFGGGLSGIVNSFKSNHGGFMERIVSDQGYGQSHWSVIVADGNSDDLFEIYATCVNGILYQYQTTPGTGYLTTAVGTAGYSVIAGDIDGDGKQELYTGGVTRFDWDGLAWRATSIGGGVDRFMAIGDGDNDGALELFGTTSDGKLLMYKLHEPGPPPITVQYEFPVDGWYLVSLASVPKDRAVSTLFPNALGGLAFTWDPILGVYAIVDTLDPGVGYWLAAHSTSISVTGAPAANFSREFDSAGWYMIGPVLHNIGVDDLISDPSGMIFVPVFGWDHISKSYAVTDTLFSQQGYWIAIGGSCTVTMDAHSLALTRKAMPEFAAQFGSAPPGPPNIDWLTGKLVELPAEFSLSQNFPNPFNPTTQIQFGLPKEAKVDLVIYDMQGRRVRSLISETRRAGHYLVTWDGTDTMGNRASSGVYIMRIQADTFMQTKKVLLIK